MRYVLFGNSGLRVSELALGTMTFGDQLGWGANREVSKQIFDAYAEAGGNHIDTANEIYTAGTSESFVGEFIKGQRERFVVGTKFTDALPGNDPNFAGNGRKSLVQSVERSLRRLGTDYVDILWVHAWDYTTPVEELMAGLDALVRVGKVLYLGITNAPAWAVAQCNALARERGWTPFTGQQVEYSLIEHSADRELVPMAKSLGLVTLGYSALASGLLTGKYSGQTNHGEDSRRLDVAAFVERSDRNMFIADEVVKVAKELGRQPSQVALNWVRQRGVHPIIGATKLAQLRDNLDALSFSIPEHLVESLDRAAAIEMGYPHEFLHKTRAVVYGGMFDKLDFTGKAVMPL